MKGPWVKLWRSFLSDPTVQYLKLRHGDVTVTSLVALLTSADDGVVTTPEDEIAVLCGLSDEDFKKIVDIIMSRGIISRNENGLITFRNWKKYQESDSAERMRKMREKRHSDVTVTDNVTEMLRVEDRRIDDRRIDNIPKPEKHEYGSENNVLMTDAQYSKLVLDLGEDMAKACIEELSEAKAMKGYKYKRDDLAIRKWVVDVVKKKGLDVPRETPAVLPGKKLVKCPVCGTMGDPGGRSQCKVCHFMLLPEIMADTEQVKSFKEEWDAEHNS